MEPPYKAMVRHGQMVVNTMKDRLKDEEELNTLLTEYYYMYETLCDINTHGLTKETKGHVELMVGLVDEQINKMLKR